GVGEATIVILSEAKDLIPSMTNQVSMAMRCFASFSVTERLSLERNRMRRKLRRFHRIRFVRTGDPGANAHGGIIAPRALFVVESLPLRHCTAGISLGETAMRWLTSLVLGMATLSAISGSAVAADLNPAAVAYTLPDKIPWTLLPGGNSQAVLA